jgi:hypothetical protein
MSASAAAAADAEDLALEEDEPDDAPFHPATAALERRLGSALTSATAAAAKAGGLLQRALSSVKAQAAERGLPALAKLPRSLRPEPAAAPGGVRRRAQTSRRTTAAPAYLRSGIHELGIASTRPRRPQSASRAAAASAAPAAPRRYGRYVALAVLLAVAGGAYGLLGGRDEPAPVAATPSAPAPATPPAPALAAAPAAPAAPPAPAHPDGIAAEVPLFGPRAMATAEPVAAATMDDATAERLAAAAAVGDQTWEDESEPKETAEAKPWGRGQLHLPTVHRIRLDGAGAELAGVAEGSGFTVVVPGRKAMESGRSIQKRDDRIAAVKASNTAEGARIGFTFRGPVPAYRVRLRKDFVEFLISAPPERVAGL